MTETVKIPADLQESYQFAKKRDLVVCRFDGSRYVYDRLPFTLVYLLERIARAESALAEREREVEQLKEQTKPKCPVCNSVRMSHCSDPEHCGGLYWPDKMYRALEAELAAVLAEASKDWEAERGVTREQVEKALQWAADEIKESTAKWNDDGLTHMKGIEWIAVKDASTIIKLVLLRLFPQQEQEPHDYKSTACQHEQHADCRKHCKCACHAARAAAHVEGAEEVADGS